MNYFNKGVILLYYKKICENNKDYLLYFNLIENFTVTFELWISNFTKTYLLATGKVGTLKNAPTPVKNYIFLPSRRYPEDLRHPNKKTTSRERRNRRREIPVRRNSRRRWRRFGDATSGTVATRWAGCVPRNWMDIVAAHAKDMRTKFTNPTFIQYQSESFL